MSEKVIIIGSGPAAWTAAIYAARAELKPLLFEGAVTQENHVNGTLPLGQLNLTTDVENFPGFPVGNLTQYLETAIPEDRRLYMKKHEGHGPQGPELLQLMRQQAVNFDTRILTEDIVKVDFKNRPFKLDASDGKTYEAQAVIVATGARANYLGIPSETRFKNHGVSACAVCEGPLPRFKNQPIAAIGGGDSAVEEATYLTKFASTVYLVHRRDKLRASKIMAERALANPKIKILWNTTVDEVLGNDKEGVTGMRLASTVGKPKVEYPITGFFLGIGHTPNTSFLGDALELHDSGYIRWTVPFRTNTSVPGVFAAGDVADDYYKQAITAAGTGCMAALDAERWLGEQGE